MNDKVDSYDVQPESEAEQIETNESTLYDLEQARLMAEQAELRAICIENGDDAEKFLSSSFGQYLLGQAELEAEQAREALTDVDADDAKTIRDLQARTKRSRSLKDWIRSAIEQGDAEYNDYLQAKIANNEG